LLLNEIKQPISHTTMWPIMPHTALCRIYSNQACRSTSESSRLVKIFHVACH